MLTHNVGALSVNTICVIPGCAKPADTGIFTETLPVCLGHGLQISHAIQIRTERNLRSHGSRRTKARYAARDKGGWIYYLRVAGRIKIGHTVNLKQRLASYPPDALLLAAEPGSRADEAALHQLFQSYRATGREWYGADHAPILERIAAVVAEHGKPADLDLTPSRLPSPRAASHKARR